MSKSKIIISAFTPPPNGLINARKDGKVYASKFIEDFQTIERYQEYKDCGFDEMLFAGEDKYIGEEYQTSKLKKMLDLCEKCGIKAVVFDERIVAMTVKTQNSIIGELFDSEQELDDYLRECVKDYKDHPAFYGVSIIDEPFIAKVDVVHQFAKAMKRVLPNAFVHTCFNPLSCVEGGPMQSVVLGEGKTGYEAYGNYIDKMSVPELGYWGYDDYPFKWWEGCSMVEKYVTTMQFVSLRCKKNNLPFHMTIQSYANNTVDRKGNPKTLTQGHFNWLANLALGFGAKKIYYYTYWRFSTRSKLDQPDVAIMNEDGSKIFYNEVKNTNQLIKKTFEEIGEYDYVASQLLNSYNGNDSTKNLVSTDLGVIAEYSSDAPLLLNKLQRSDGKAIYMLQNLRHPEDNELNKVRLVFNKNKDPFTALVNGEKVVVNNNNERALLFALEPGEAVWFLDLEN
ncbi:MAG: hypothetical protein IKJ19_00135 [Clostridia bacterium]|nr:hypothetical protein [Clostridia bacterium]